ncbi:citramalate synthase [Ruficoccus sp. ZRK36]|uniref:citramalate synthase n=1 Tax=Ruficoccus sp. ZRK36 TaxID=2866311 RepID=UPI001C731289|nr:citramalate synthase [Ruficoccus sp. ZRK36]QYY35426.1 citramalate synthase [Ruficoccus sp. ZRK36]
MNPDSKVFIYDTTLRDGTQGEGVSFSVSTKLRVAEKLDQFGVDYIEGGWPGSNPRDVDFFQQAKELELSHAKIAAFGSTRRANTPVEEDPQVQLLIDAETPVVTIFGKTWLMHVTEVIRTTAEENLAMIEDTVRHLKSNGREVHYDAEHFFDGYKDNPEYALSTLAAAQRGGADFLTLCDTNGGMMVHEVSEVVKSVVERFPDAKIGMHCHNDCGLGVAVSLAGVREGACIVQGTMNGFGERNGNANLTSIIANLSLKLGYQVNCAPKLNKLRDISLFVDEMANLRPDIRAPFVGAASFVHKGGVHADAVNKVKHSYEHISPEAVGNRTRVLVSDMSGRSSVMMKANEMGLNVDPKSPQMKEFLEELKGLEYRGYEYEAADASFRLMLARFLKNKPDHFEVIHYRVIDVHGEWKDELTSEASVKLRINGEVYHTVAEATGPVGALDLAIRRALEQVYPQISSVRLMDFKVRILDGKQGADSIIRVQIESTDGEKIWGTVGASDDIIEASWEALLDSYEYKLLLDAQQQ